jgi:hypothetical protein
MSQGMREERIVQKGTNKTIPRHVYVYDKRFTVRLPNRSGWKDGLQHHKKGRLVWYTDGSKIKKALRLGSMVMVQRRSIASAL